MWKHSISKPQQLEIPVRFLIIMIKHTYHSSYLANTMAVYNLGPDLIQYKDVLTEYEIPLWGQDGGKILLSPLWDFLYWYNVIFIFDQPPDGVQSGVGNCGKFSFPRLKPLEAHV